MIKKISTCLLTLILAAAMFAPLSISAGYEGLFSVTLHIRYSGTGAGDTRVDTFMAAPGMTLGQLAEDFGRKFGREYAVGFDFSHVTAEPGMVVNLYGIETERVTFITEYPYGTQLMFTDNLPEGYRLTVSPGRAGTAFVTEEVRFKPETGISRVELSRARVHEEITMPPVDEIVAIGNGPADLPVPYNKEQLLADLRPARMPSAEIVLTDRQVVLSGGENPDGNGRIFMPAENPEPLFDTFVTSDYTWHDSFVSSDYTWHDSFVTNDYPRHFGPSVINGYSQLIPAHYLTMDEYLPFHVDGNFIFVNGEAFEFSRHMTVSSTAYTADYQNTGKRPCHPQFGITASGLRAQLGVVAVDRNVIPFHTLLYVEGYGFAVAGDTGGRVRGYVVDLFFETAAEVRAHGRQQRNVFILSDQSMDIAIRR